MIVPIQKLSLLALVLATGAQAVELSADKNFRYDLKFTNPICGPHAYTTPVRTADGQRNLQTKPQDVYCSGKEDIIASGSRPDSVQSTLQNWVLDSTTKNIFFAALSFSSSAFYKAVCQAASRGVKVTYILDAPGAPTGLPALEQNPDCNFNGQTTIRFIQRGHTPGTGSGDAINWAHNKILIINPEATGDGKTDEVLKVAFGSGNFSGGVVTHHENWHFIQASRSTYFMQSHLCMYRALLDDKAASSRSAYANSIKSCRLKTGLQEESDIRAFFSPGQGQEATRVIEQNIAQSKEVRIGAHRFTYSRLISALRSLLLNNPSANVKFVGDDDLYWLTVPADQGGGQFGDNGPDEAGKLAGLKALGKSRFQIKYMETNHGAHQLHHSKYLIFSKDGVKADAVFTGAGNLTGDAFDNNQPSGNFENFYFIRIPEKVKQFQAQHKQLFDGEQSPYNKDATGHEWQGRATSSGQDNSGRNDMPVGNPLP